MPLHSSETAQEKETGRIEAFSDGVFAIAITLLILEIKVPHAHDLQGGLGNALLHLWPSYLSFLTSFLTILVMWINHHRIFGQIHRSDQTFLILNGLLLLCVTALPFPTALLAEYLTHSDGTIAAAVYSGTFIVISILFNVLWRYASTNGRLLSRAHDPAVVRGITEQYRFGPLMYVVTFGVAFASALVSFLLCLLLAVYFAWPKRGGRG